MSARILWSIWHRHLTYSVVAHRAVPWPPESLCLVATAQTPLSRQLPFLCESFSTSRLFSAMMRACSLRCLRIRDASAGNKGSPGSCSEVTVHSVTHSAHACSAKCCCTYHSGQRIEVVVGLIRVVTAGRFPLLLMSSVVGQRRLEGFGAAGLITPG